MFKHSAEGTVIQMVCVAKKQSLGKQQLPLWSLQMIINEHVLRDVAGSRGVRTDHHSCVTIVLTHSAEK